MKATRFLPALPGVLLLALAGCSPQPDSTTPAVPPNAQDVTKKFSEPVPAPTTGTPPQIASGNAPAGGTAPQTGGTVPQVGGTPGANANLTAEAALKKVPEVAPQLAPQKKAMDDAEAALKKSPADPKTKSAYVDATYNYAHSIMQTGDPKTIMYRASLALYRRILKVDPAHQPSLDDKKMIEAIYASLNRPVPQ